MLAAERVAEYTGAVKSMEWPLHITLTVKNTATISQAQIVALAKAFRRLRQRKLWKTCVRGGFAALEIVNTGNGWHPHLHIVSDCEWMGLVSRPAPRWATKEAKLAAARASSAELGAVWSEIVGQEFASLKMRRVWGGPGGTAKLVKEVMKYPVKPGDLLEMQGRALDVVRAIEKVRLFRGFGNCYKRKLLAEELREPHVCECGAVGCLRPEAMVENAERNSTLRVKTRRTTFFSPI